MPPRIPPPGFLAISLVLMFALHEAAPLAHWIDAAWRPLALGLALAAVAINLTAFLQFRRASTTINPIRPDRASRLVTSGIFGISRNPMYVGMALLLLAWAIALGSASPWFVPPLFVALIHTVQILPEERALAGKFGEDYLAYRRAVPRWLGVPAGRRA